MLHVVLAATKQRCVIGRSKLRSGRGWGPRSVKLKLGSLKVQGAKCCRTNCSKGSLPVDISCQGVLPNLNTWRLWTSCVRVCVPCGLHLSLCCVCVCCFLLARLLLGHRFQHRKILNHVARKRSGTYRCQHYSSFLGRPGVRPHRAGGRAFGVAHRTWMQ